MAESPKILITGGSGLLGNYIVSRAAENFDVLSLYRSAPGIVRGARQMQADITSEEALTEIFSSFRPDAVIHAAAVSNPNKTKGLTPGAVYEINVTVTERIAMLAERYNARLIYTSTDLVYAGYRGSMLREDAKLVPLTLYAETKLLGERKIQKISTNYLILRTCLLYGFGTSGKQNFFHLMTEALSRGEKADVFTDQYRTPLYLDDAARIIVELLGTEAKNEVINFGGPQRISRAEMGELVCKYGNFSPALLNKITMAERPDIVPVEDVSLDTTKLRSLGITQRPVEDCVRDAFKNFRR